MPSTEGTRQVVIAGGGPVGLWLAAELRLHGAEVTVLEARTEPDPHSRASSVHPRTLEMLDCRGVIEPFLAEGLRVPRGHFAALSSWLDFRRLDTPYPFSLALPQVRTEQLLAAHAVTAGADLRRGHRVTGLTQDDRAVTVHVDGPDGPYRLRAAYLVGCDGTRSTVREAAGIDFPGTPATAWAWMGDVVLDTPPRHPSCSNERGAFMAFPLPGGTHRIAGNDAATNRTRPTAPLTFDQLRAKVRDITGTDYGMRDAGWTSTFGNAARQAARYRNGRVLLAGDAAHAHFPAGGPGLNTGLQDAFNLGWKLARVLDGTADDTLLDSYHAERHPAGADVLRSTRAQAGLMTGHTPEHLAMRELLCELIDGVPEFSDDLAARAAGLAAAYPPDPAAGAHPLTGTRAPDLHLSAPTGTTTLFTLLRPGHPVLLDLTGRAAHPDLRGPDRPGPERPGSGLPGPGRLTRHSAPLAEPRADWRAVTAALVRPDGHLAWLTEETDPEALATATRTATAAF
ncbi:FAD-dependent monooxygenase [Kitasatospora sp. NPDC093550]|uniref:FAD-dependent monooxygenase n=1 Tax=Kitasatospora sp. NPDC093550 TaxID=3364089 RepID=UPI0038260BEF